MIEYTVVRSGRKSICIQVKAGGAVIVRAPEMCFKKEIEEFVRRHEEWIDKKVKLAKERMKKCIPETPEHCKMLKETTTKLVMPRVEHFSKLMGLYPTSVRVTDARTRLGSCSTKNAICFSFYLALYPEEFVDYVVVHELAHIRHKNHGDYFHEMVEKYIPSHREIEKMKSLVTIPPKS